MKRCMQEIYGRRNAKYGGINSLVIEEGNQPERNQGDQDLEAGQSLGVEE
jgi:hypothetical protein